MKEDFVTYEQAVNLKELEFDLCVNHYYKDNKLIQISGYSDNYCNVNANAVFVIDECYSSPTLAQAQKWLREVKGIIICIEPRFYASRKPLAGYEYHLFNKDDGWYSYIESKTVYDTYEEALSVCIDKALEILKEE